MILESTLNRIYVDDVNLCYRIDNVSYILTSNPSTMCFLIWISLSSLSVVTICGNLLVITSIIYFKQLHTPTNYLILSQAVTDLLVGVLVFPFSMAFSLSSCMYNEDLFCMVRNSLDISVTASSVLNLCCISIDRYYAVYQPLTYRTQINGCVVVIMILVSWSVSGVVTTVFLMAGSMQDKCKEKCLTDVLVTMIGIIFLFYVPLIIMLYIYLKIFLVAQRQARSIQGTKSGATVSKMDIKATKTLAIVVGVFLMSWTPLLFYLMFNSLGYGLMPVLVTEATHWLAMSNSMLNPFIYAFFYSWFRSAFRIIISGKIFRGDFANSKLH